MAEAGAVIATYSNAVTAVAAAGAAAAAAGTTRSRYTKNQSTNYQGTGPSHLNTASYMNNLRAPAHSLRPLGLPARGAIGVHLHYQGRCPHAGHSHSDDDVYLPHTRDERTSYSHMYRSFPGSPHSTTPASAYPASPCGCAQCYWSDFLTDDVEKYHITRRFLRETYLWNLEELVRRHCASSTKPRAAKDNELDKLYWYYVARVREVYDNHCRHHRLLFYDATLVWETPEKVTIREEDVEPTTSRSRSRHSSGSSRALLLLSRNQTQPQTPLSRNENERCLELAATQVDGGNAKGKDVNRDENAVIPCSGRDNGGGERGRANEEADILPLPLPNNHKKARSKPNRRYSMKRLRHQLWPTKTREKTVDKPGPD